jgi:hypothetical protein
MPHRLAAALLMTAITAAPAAAQVSLTEAPLTEAEVRAFAARQAQALNAGDLSAYFATFAPQARFTQQALGSDNQIVPYGTSTLPEARRQLSRAAATSRITETVTVRRVAIGGRGRGAALSAQVRTRIEGGGKVRQSCAERIATVARVGGALKTFGQTDTLVRCRTAP